jgi:hypothetical protein
MKTFSNQIPVYINAGYDCYDALNNVSMRVIKKQVGINNIPSTLLDRQDYLIADDININFIHKKIVTIYYNLSYQTHIKKQIGFKLNGSNKGVVFTFNDSNKKLFLENHKTHFDFIVKDNKIRGIIKNKKNKILIILCCNS